ncbi:DUF434 domain-containing protein [Methanocaldococcus indicus]|uniref:DUF434 domain-containing protein n=1 Tax=Methanocaldococcus indicus TaxID=213231 RepID=UPI003C6CCEDD
MSNKIEDAKKDFKYLIDRGYKKKVAINFVGNHYKLTKEERDKILRSIHTDEEIKITKKKLTKLEDVDNLAIDGFNVLITIKALLAGRAFLCDDNIYRDLERGKYKISDFLKVIDILSDILKDKIRDKKVEVYLDAQKSRSGDLAKILKERGFNVFCVKNVDYILKNKEVVATSDSIIIKSENVKKVVDLAKEVKDYLNGGFRCIQK